MPRADTRKLRVHFVTQDDPLYVIRFFESFLSDYPRDEIEVVGITITQPFRESRYAMIRRMLRFYGAFDFSRVVARVADARLHRRSIARLAEREGIPVLPTASVNDPTYVERVREKAPDVVFSVAAPEIFRGELLTATPLGCINIHSGRLPKYRGMMPTFWQMLSGEEVVTVTVHEMVAELDAGAVLGSLEYPVRKRDSLDRVMTETKREGAKLAIGVLRELRSGRAARRRLDMSDASYFSFPAPRDVARFRERGHRLL